MDSRGKSLFYALLMPVDNISNDLPYRLEFLAKYWPELATNDIFRIKFLEGNILKPDNSLDLLSTLPN